MDNLSAVLSSGGKWTKSALSLTVLFYFFENKRDLKQKNIKDYKTGVANTLESVIFFSKIFLSYFFVLFCFEMIMDSHSVVRRTGKLCAPSRKPCPVGLFHLDVHLYPLSYPCMINW